MPARFDPNEFPIASKTTVMLDIAPLPTGPMLQLPVLVARGREPGKTVVVLGGVHGDEYEGMAATREVYRELDPQEMRGTFIGVPVVNPPAFATHTRTSPLDGQNMARVFPGRADGTISEQIAHQLLTQVLKQADFLIDLHSSGSYMSMPLLIGYFHGDTEAGRVSHEAALRFGLPVVWGHEGTSEGRTLSEPHKWGVPWLYTESPSGGWLHSDVAAQYADGVFNVMRYLGILPGEAPAITPTARTRRRRRYRQESRRSCQRLSRANRRHPDRGGSRRSARRDRRPRRRNARRNPRPILRHPHAPPRNRQRHRGRPGVSPDVGVDL